MFINKQRQPPHKHWANASVAESLTEAFKQLCLTITKAPRLQILLQKSNPVVISGQGGSCTRLIAEILRKSNKFHLLFSSKTTLDSFSMRKSGLNKYHLMNQLLRDTHSLNYTPNQVNPLLRADIRQRCRALVRNISSEGRSREIWGFKEPLILFWLPFFYENFRNMKFIHVIRDVRGIRCASEKESNFMHIQETPELHQSYFSKHESVDQRVRFEELWSALNLDIKTWANANIKSNYYILKVEDIIGPHKKVHIERLLDFVGITPSSHELLRLTQLPRELRSFDKKIHSPKTKKALIEFGYHD